MAEIEAAGDILIMVGSPSQAISRDGGTRADCSIVQAARAGSRDAFDHLYRQYSPMVHGILLARVPWHEVDDLAQDVFLTVYRRISSLRDAEAFGPWLAMIARNRAMDFHRRNRKSQELSDNISERSRSEAEADAEKILSVIRGLPEAYRETLILRLVEGMSGPEIAERTGLTPASVRVNLHRGMKMLRESLGMEGAQ